MWTVVYSDGNLNTVRRVDSKEGALDLACRMIKEGQVILLVTPSPALIDEKPISMAEIQALYAEREGLQVRSA